MAHLRIEKLSNLAELVLAPNTMYFVESTVPSLVDIYISDAAGTLAKRTANEQNILSSYVTIQPDPPALPCSTQLWWSSANGALYIQYEVSGYYNWVEAVPGTVIPEFAGNGVAETMARSDHWHEGIILSANQW